MMTWADGTPVPYRERKCKMNIKDKIEELEKQIQDGRDLLGQITTFFNKKNMATISIMAERQLTLKQDELLKLKQQGVYDPMWTPANCVGYFYIYDGIAYLTVNTGEDSDTWNITTNNTYQTEYHCKKAIEAEKLKGEIREFARVENGEWRADWTKGDHKCYLYVNNIVPEVRFSWFNSHDHLQKLPNFRTETIAKKAIKKFGDRIQELQAYI